MHCGTALRLILLTFALSASFALETSGVNAQAIEQTGPDRYQAVRIEKTGIGILAASSGVDQDALAVPEDSPGRPTPTKQTLLIGGLAASMAAYGYFILKFNNSRGRSDDAEKVYEDDVRSNAQSYVDQGISLDEIQTFRDWQHAYEDAKSSREWAARAGFLAIVIGFFAILDAATSSGGPAPRSAGIVVHPTVSVTAARRDLVVGARLKF